MSSPNNNDETFVTKAVSDQDVRYKKPRLHEGLEPFLVILTGHEKGKKIILLSSKTTIGRSGRNHIQVKDALVSSFHAEVLNENGQLILMDLQSKNGSFVNGNKQEKKVLKTGDRLLFGNTEILVTIPAIPK